MEKILNIAVTGAEDLPIPAVHGGAVEVLVEELIRGNERNYKFNIDLYTVSDPLLDTIKYKHCNIIQMYPEEIKKFQENFEEKKSSLGLAINEKMKNKKYDFVLVEHSMRVYNSIQNHKNLIFHLHCNIDDERYRPKWLSKKIIDTSYCTLSVSQFVANALNKIEVSEKNKVFYNCIDFDVFNLDNIDDDFIKNFKRNNNIKENDFCFVYSGRVRPEKGVLQLIKAFKMLRKKYDNIKLLIIGKPDFGNDDETEYTRKLKEISGEIKDDIVFTGFVNHDDIPTVLSIGDCAVIPSMYEEAFGVVALEAMAMKKAVISTISGGLTEPLNDECAIFVDKRNDATENIYKAMEQIVENKDFTKKMGEAGYKRVHSIYDFDSKNYFDNFCKKIQIEDFIKKITTQVRNN